MTASILGLQATESESETVKQVNSGLGGHPLLTESTSRLGSVLQTAQEQATCSRALLGRNEL